MILATKETAVRTGSVDQNIDHAVF